jgi:hypothetical protein
VTAWGERHTDTEAPQRVAIATRVKVGAWQTLMRVRSVQLCGRQLALLSHRPVLEGRTGLMQLRTKSL